MSFVQSPKILPLLLLVSLAVWAAHATDPRNAAPPITANGAYVVVFQVKTPSTVPDGATISCKAQITPRLSSFESLTSKADPVESTQGVAKVTGSSATCAVEIPFAFAQKNLRNGADLGYEIDAYTSDGPAFVRTQQGIDIAYPRSGATEKLSLNVAL
jgi:hypothetical protein